MSAAPPVEDHNEAGADPPAAAGGRTTRASLRTAWRSRLALHAATVLVTVAFSYIALKGVNFSAVWHALRTSDYAWLVPALALFGVALVCRALRWRSLFAHGRRPRQRAVTNAMLVGYLYNNILPARAGEAVRVVVLTQRGPAPAVEVIGTVVLERLYDVTAILLIFFAASPWLPHVSWVRGAAIAAIALVVLIAAASAILVIYGERPLRFVLSPLRRLPWFAGERLEHTIAELTHGLSGLRHGTVALEAAVWTFGAWLTSAVSAWFVTKCFPLHATFACGLLITVGIGLSNILPAPPAGIGVFEGAALLSMKAFGIGRSVALPCALVLHMTNFVPFVVLGVICLQHNARHPVRRAAGASAEPAATA